MPNYSKRTEREMKDNRSISPTAPKLNEVQEQLMVALRIMRDACDDAEREILGEKSQYTDQ